METTFAPAAPIAVPSTPAALSRLGALPMRSKVVLGLATLGLTAAIAMGVASSRQPDWRVLYASVGDKDGGAIITALTQLAVPHKFSEGGGAIMVPADKVHEVRLRLASQGLPKGGTVGFELMENQRFGVTQFQERLNFQRGLEGELARSIMALGSVQAARVHLALPQQTAFLREQQKPSASVLLTMHAGRTLDRAQVAGIVHLVASSVPELQPRSVSVVDQTGSLLSQVPGETPNGLDASQLQYVRQTEQNLATRILSILEPIVGPGNVRAQVTADMDFTQAESTAETYAPNQGDKPATVRSQQLSEAPGGAGAGGALAGGVPGALANQPPNTASSPVNGGAAPLNGGAPGAGTGIKRDATTNYEVDKTVKVTRHASGVLKRLSAAVVVNHASVTAADGKVSLKAIEPAQMEQINALVREAMGFNKDRGDSINVVNAAFNRELIPTPPVLPLWRQPEMIELARTFAPWIALPLATLIIILGLVRPALRASRTPAAKPALLQATVEDPVSLPEPVVALDGRPGVPLLPTAEGAAQQTRSLQLEGIRQLARENPATVANVVRNWVSPPAA